MQLQKNGTVDCPAFGGTGKISERDGTGEKSLWEPDLPQDGRIFRAGIFRATRTRRWGVLIDESASMDIHNRIGSARYTACVIYRFCQRLGIPRADSWSFHRNWREKESVELYSYAEFDAWDQKDCFRLTGIRSRWNNRDGAALAYAGMRLGKRAEGQKLLFVISDGLPSCGGGIGEAGIADTRREREKLEHRGIHVMAAAIGEDRELIRRIYGKRIFEHIGYGTDTCGNGGDHPAVYGKVGERLGKEWWKKPITAGSLRVRSQYIRQIRHFWSW